MLLTPLTNKLVFFPGKPFLHSQPTQEGVPFLLANIRLDQKYSPGTNILGSSVTEKACITSTTGACTIKLFTAVIVAVW